MIINEMDKSKTGEGNRELRRVAILKSLVREGFTEKVTFEHRPKEGEGVSYVDKFEVVVTQT